MLFWTLLASLNETPHPVVLFLKYLEQKSDRFHHFSDTEKSCSDPSLNQPNSRKS